jgi:hypothetical protein
MNLGFIAAWWVCGILANVALVVLSASYDLQAEDLDLVPAAKPVIRIRLGPLGSPIFKIVVIPLAWPYAVPRNFVTTMQVVAARDARDAAKETP